MSEKEYEGLVVWIVRIVIYGSLGAIALGILIVFLRTIRANIRSRGFMGLLIVIVQLTVFIGIIMIIIYFGNEYGIIDKIQDLIP